MTSSVMIKTEEIFIIVGIGKNSQKAVEDFRYIFSDKLNISGTVDWNDLVHEGKQKQGRYICCTYEREIAIHQLDKRGMVHKKDYLFAEEFFSLLDDWKGCRIAYKSYPGSIRGWFKAIAYGYAAKHGKVLLNDANRNVLCRRYNNIGENRYSKKPVKNKNTRIQKLEKIKYFLLGMLASWLQIFAKKNLYEKYDYICFCAVSDAIRFKKVHPSVGDKVITIEELKAHTMASLYMRAVYFDSRQNSCTCDNPFHTLWVGEGGTTRLCGCPDFLDIGCGNMGVTDCVQIWKSPLARIIRLSVINHTYTFCSRELCRMFGKNTDKADLIERINGVSEGDHPRYIKVANDYTCNLHCPSCRNGVYAKNSSGKETEIVACIDALSTSGWLDQADRLAIGASGETFLSEHYKRILYEGNFKRNSVLIMTNGTLFTPEEWEKMENKYDRISFSVSVDAATRDTYEKVRCGGKFDRLMKNMEFLSMLRKEKKVEMVEVNMVVQKANYREIPEFIRWAKRMGFDRAYLSHIWNWGTYSDTEFDQNISMFDKNGIMKPELADVLNDPICEDPIVDMRWEG